MFPGFHELTNLSRSAPVPVSDSLDGRLVVKEINPGFITQFIDAAKQILNETGRACVIRCIARLFGYFTPNDALSGLVYSLPSAAHGAGIGKAVPRWHLLE